MKKQSPKMQKPIDSLSVSLPLPGSYPSLSLARGKTTPPLLSPRSAPPPVARQPAASTSPTALPLSLLPPCAKEPSTNGQAVASVSGPSPSPSVA